MPRSFALGFVSTALLLEPTTADDALCTKCKDTVNQLANEGTQQGCAAACKLIPGASSLCSTVCSLIPTICGKDAKINCGDDICSAISICEHNPWMYESVWNFSLPTDTHTLDDKDIITLHSTEPSDDVPAGTVKIGIKCTAGTWWKAVTMFKGTKFLREVAHTQDHKGETNWGSVSYADLKDHYFSLSKAKMFGVHTNVYHITNAVDMKERGTYLFDWSKDGFEAAEVELAAPTGKYCGRVPIILDMTVTFNSDNTVDFYDNIHVAFQKVDCKAESFAVSGNQVTFTNIGKDGDCMGDALRKQHKDTSKFVIDINGDGTLTFKSTWPDLKLTPCNSENAVVV